MSRVNSSSPTVANFRCLKQLPWKRVQIFFTAELLTLLVPSLLTFKNRLFPENGAIMVYATHRQNICRYFKWLSGKISMLPCFKCLKTSSFKITKYLLCSLIKHWKSQITCTFYLLAGKTHIPVVTLQQLLKLKRYDFFFINEWSTSPLIKNTGKDVLF